MRRDLLGNLETAAILEVRGNPRRSEGVVSDLRMDAGSLCRLRIIRQASAWLIGRRVSASDFPTAVRNCGPLGSTSRPAPLMYASRYWLNSNKGSKSEIEFRKARS